MPEENGITPLMNSVASMPYRANSWCSRRMARWFAESASGYGTVSLGIAEDEQSVHQIAAERRVWIQVVKAMSPLTA